MPGGVRGDEATDVKVIVCEATPETWTPEELTSTEKGLRSDCLAGICDIARPQDSAACRPGRFNRVAASWHSLLIYARPSWAAIELPAADGGIPVRD